MGIDEEKHVEILNNLMVFIFIFIIKKKGK
jgi:hypothetical protein